MQKLATSTIAVLLGVAWTVVPAAAADTTADKAERKMERAADKVEDKAERAGDKLQEKADRLGDKLERKTDPAKDRVEDKAERAKDKTESTMDKAKDKAESAMDKVKDKARETKDKIRDKVSGRDDRPRGEMRARGDVRTAQQVLRDKGHDPGRIDGVMGPRTSAAVRAFQKAEGLTETGRLDAQTMEKLGVQASSASPRTESSSAPAQR